MNLIKSPKITVLMSVYNSQEFLKDAIESILNQTFKDFEFLIIDDGSNDKSLEIISSYHDRRIVLINNEMNMGLAKSLNKGLHLAKGKYIARMDADDIALPFRLDRQFTFMEENTEVDICGSWVQTIGDGVENIWRHPTSNDEIKVQLLFNSALVHPSVFMRKKSIFDKGLFYNESIKRAQDYELWSRVAITGEMRNIPEVLLKYRLHSDQTGKKYKESQIDTARNVRINLLKKLNIILSEEDYIVHSSLSYFQTVDYWSASKWLIKLIEANQKAGYCSEEVFNKFAYERYWNTCANNYKLSSGSFRAFINAPIQKYGYRSYKTYIKQFVKHMVRGKL